MRSPAWAVAALLWLAAAAPERAAPGPCHEPSELAAAGGASVLVGCAGEGGAAPRGAARLLLGLRLDPNRADPAALETLPGIGPARAAAIAAERCRAPFTRPGDLVRVRGIGPLTAARLEPWLEPAPGAAPSCRGPRRPPVGRLDW